MTSPAECLVACRAHAADILEEDLPGLRLDLHEIAGGLSKLAMAATHDERSRVLALANGFVLSAFRKLTDVEGAAGAIRCETSGAEASAPAPENKES